LQILGSIMRILIVTALIALAGCASQNGAGTVSPAASDAPAQAVEAPVAQVASTQPASATTAAEDAEAVFQPPPGYKRRPDMGENIYCTKITVLGSRFPKDDCRSEAELRDLIMQRGSARGEMEQRRNVCTTAAGCANN
jgi:hypothetical protein